MEELTRPYGEDPRYYPGLYIQKLDKLFGGPNKKGLLSEFDKRSCTLIRPLRKARFPEGTPVIYHCYKDIKQLCKLKPQLVHLKIPEGAKSWGAYQIWLTKRGAEMAEKLNAWQKENQTKPKTDPKKRKETLALNLPAQKRKKVGEASGMDEKETLTGNVARDITVKITQHKTKKRESTEFQAKDKAQLSESNEEPKDFDNMVDQPIEEETTYLTTQPEPESETVNSPERLDDILALEKSGKIFISGVQNYLNEYKNQVSCQYKLDLSQAKKRIC